MTRAKRRVSTMLVAAAALCSSLATRWREALPGREGMFRPGPRGRRHPRGPQSRRYRPDDQRMKVSRHLSRPVNEKMNYVGRPRMRSNRNHYRAG